MSNGTAKIPNDQALAKLPETFFDSKLPEISKVIPRNTITAEALARIVITSMNRTPKLRACTAPSIMEVLFNCATVGLIPNNSNGHAWVIPYDDQATLQIGFKGFAEIAYRSGNVRLIQADTVREGDYFKYMKGAGENVKPFVEHSVLLEKGRASRELKAAWASCELTNRAVTIDVLDPDEIAKIRRMADPKSPAWKYFEDEMAKKSAVKRLLKLQQLSNMETLRQAIEIDNKTSDLGLLPINGNGHVAPAEHKLVLTDELSEGTVMVEEQDAKS